MLTVDRKFFTIHSPYNDSPQSIGHGATISAPHMHAYALEVLKDHLKEGNRALDVGSGSGYLVACFAMMVGKSGKVVGIEHIEELVKKSIENINKWDKNMLSSGNIKLLSKFLMYLFIEFKLDKSLYCSPLNKYSIIIISKSR